ncbi:MAG: peptide-methionine (S)-S-oxide reductase MsrA [Fimbriimonadaceae bacterium]|nr:peptide-methionine (S)-S-oxide reductase MsrA [Fimbriimonadaceae bacterium]
MAKMGMLFVLVSAAVIGLAVFSVRQGGDRKPLSGKIPAQVTIPKDAKEIVLGGGCFWCIETLFEELEGVYTVESGYAGGKSAQATYADVSSGTSGHAETIKIFYNPKVITAHDLLTVFMTVHDPTTLNRQGPDSGPQYRSVIFYSNDEEKKLGQQVIDEIAKEKIWPNKIVTVLEPLKNYIRAEEYHQDYFNKYENASDEERARMNGGYCRAIIEPKVKKFRAKFASKLKKKG